MPLEGESLAEHGLFMELGGRRKWLFLLELSVWETRFPSGHVDRRTSTVAQASVGKAVSVATAEKIVDVSHGIH